MKKIAFLIPTLKNGGAERVVSNLSLNLPKTVEHDLIVFENASIDYAHAARLIETNLSSKKSLLGKAYNVFLRVWKMIKIKNNEQYDTVISFMEGANFVNILSRRKEKVIVSVRLYIEKHENKQIGMILDYIIKKLYDRADLIVVVSKKLKELMKSKYRIDEKKIRVIYNPIDHKKINELSNEPIDNSEINIFSKKVIINVGRMETQKGQWHLLKAYAEIIKRMNDCNLVFLGTGTLEKRLKILAARLGISENVYFLGFKKNPYKYISKSDVFVLSSLAEGFPNAVLEAMECGVPIVSTDCKSGPRELLEPTMDINEKLTEIRECEFGILTPDFDFAFDIEKDLTHEEILLSEAIMDLLCDDDKLLKYRKKSKERAKDFYIENIVEQWLEII